jgi:hypothetical protein
MVLYQMGIETGYPGWNPNRLQFLLMLLMLLLLFLLLLLSRCDQGGQ